MSSINIQPKDIRKMLRVENDEDYELVLKTLRFMFDILCYAKDGSTINTGMVSFVKCSDDEFYVQDEDRTYQFKIIPETQTEVIFQELAEALSRSAEIILPV